MPLALQVASGRRPFIELFGRDDETRDGTCVRDFIHVSDLSDAHRLALQKLFSGLRCQAFNLGRGNGYSVQEVITAVRRVSGARIQVHEAGRREGDTAVQVADSRLARRVLGWQPRFADIESMVRHASAWEKRMAGCSASLHA